MYTPEYHDTTTVLPNDTDSDAVERRMWATPVLTTVDVADVTTSGAIPVGPDAFGFDLLS